MGFPVYSGPRPNVYTSGTPFEIVARLSAFAIGVDLVDAVGWFGTTQLFTSVDNVTLTGPHALPPVVASAAQISKVVRFGSNVYCTGYDNTNVQNVWKSIPPSAGAVSWSSVLTMAGTQGIGPALNCSSGWPTDYLFAADYGNPAGGPSIWRTPDGTSWTRVLGPITDGSGLNHFHAVACDPYNPGHVYATAGDGKSKVLYRSTDYGSNWTLVVTDDNFQALQVSFAPGYVWLAGDVQRITAWVLQRSHPTVPLIASKNHHAWQMVPGGYGAKGKFTDGSLTSGSPAFTSATAPFTSDDVGKFIRFTGVPFQIAYTDGIYIASFSSTSSVNLNKNAGGTVGSLPFFIEGDSFYRSANYGIVDPSTGIYYTVASDSTSGGNRCGLFAIPAVGGEAELLQTFPGNAPGELFIRAGKIWFHQWAHPLISAADIAA